MSRTRLACGITLVLLLGSTLVVGWGASPASLPVASPGLAELAGASTSLAQGRGPAVGHGYSCHAIGALSMGCTVGSPEVSTPTNGLGWGEICAKDSCSPPGRGGAGMTYDAETGYVVLFGGIINLTTAANTTFSDTWVFANGNWTQLHIPGPSARLGEYMAYDYRDNYIVMFGGGPYLTLNSSLYYDDTWTFQNGTWTELNLAVHPNARGLGGFTYDTADGYLLMYGGMTSETDIHSDTWTFWGGQWHNLSLAYHPPSLLSPALTYDAAEGYVLLFGGATPDPALEFGDDLEQTWSYSHGVWTNLTSSILGSVPEGRVLSAMAFDPAQGYVILYGGWNTTTGALFGDTWIFLDGFWTELFLSPSPAPAIIGGSLISTSNSSGLFLFGGIVGTYTNYAATNATWVFGPPPANTSAPLGGPGASTYTVRSVSAPSSCRPPAFDVTDYAGGEASLGPGAYNATAVACPGYTFAGWYVAGSLTVSSATRLTTTVDVVGNGTLTAYYEPQAAATYHPEGLVLGGVLGATALLVVAALWIRQRRWHRLEQA